MSVLRHASFFERQTLKDGYTRLYRRFGSFEKILLIAGEPLVTQIRGSLEDNLFEVHAAEVASGGIL